MASRSFALETGGPKRVTVSWKGVWKNVTVAFDGTQVGAFATKAELEKGGALPLPDGSRLEVKLARAGMNVELQVSRDGVPLPGSSADPEERVKAAAYLFYFVAALTVGLSVVALAFGVGFLLALGLGIASIVEGAIYGVLGFFTLRHSMIALLLGVGLFGLDTVYTLVAQVAAGHPAVGSLVVRAIFFVAMVRAVPAMRTIKRQAKAAAQPAA